MDQQDLKSKLEIEVRYPVTMQVISGSKVTTDQVSTSRELLRRILGLRPGESINIILTSDHEGSTLQ